MSESQTLSGYYRADGDPEGPVDHDTRMPVACGFCWTYDPNGHSQECQDKRG